MSQKNLRAQMQMTLLETGLIDAISEDLVPYVSEEEVIAIIEVRDIQL